MLRYVARAATSTLKWGGKKSMWAGLVAFALWSCIEMYDGAHDRLQTRYVQAKEAVVPPAENTYEKVTAIAEKLWASIEENPGPSILALSLFIMTVLYHKYHGKDLKTALLSTITHATAPSPPEPRIIIKAQQDLMFKFLTDSEKELEEKIGKLPDEIAERERVVYTLQKEADRAKEQFDSKQQRANKHKDEFEALKRQYDTAKQDLKDIKEQLGKAI